MIIIDIPNDFTKTPGWRTYDDGPFSGQEFYDKLLKKGFEDALAQNKKKGESEDPPISLIN